MKKHILAMCGFALFASSAQAEWEPNWLLGISGAYNWNNNDDFEGNIFHAITGRATNFVRNNDSGDGENNWSWGFLGGYQAMCNGWLLGTELSIDWQDNTHEGDDVVAFTDANTPNRGWTGNADFHRDYAIALTGRIGYQVYPFLIPYIRAGAETSRDKISFSLFTPAGVPYLIANGDGRRQSYRFIAGLGTEVPIPVVNGLTFRAEWNYHTKGHVVEASGLANDNSTVAVVSNHQSINTGKVSLVYNLSI